MDCQFLFHWPTKLFTYYEDLSLLYKKWNFELNQNITRKFVATNDPVIWFLYARLKNGTYYAVAMSVRPSVRPSVQYTLDMKNYLRTQVTLYEEDRKKKQVCGAACFMAAEIKFSKDVRVFRTFYSTCFEISIWNLVYTFSRWHDMSSLSCITIGLLWPSLEPKVGQTYFLQSWPHKSR